MLDIFLKIQSQPSLTDWILVTSSVFTALAAVGATLFYIYSRNKDLNSEVFNQIRFLKDIILPRQTKVLRANDMNIPKIALTSFDFEEIKKEKHDVFLQQIKIGKDESHEEQTAILNDLEELSLRIIHYGNENNSTLDCIKDSFVDTVEYNACVLLLQRNVSKNFYNGIVKVYKGWKKFK